MAEDKSKWLIKWRRLNGNAKSDGRVCNISLDQYIQLASDAGITNPDQIGRSIDSYQLGRLGDKGGYELGNCRFITHRQNQDEKIINGLTGLGETKYTLDRLAQMANTKRGRTKESHGYVATQARAIMGRTKETHSHVASQADKVSKCFELIDPQGFIHIGKNLYQFTKSHGLTNSLMSEVCSGKKTQYKGWTGRYIYDNDE